MCGIAGIIADTAHGQTDLRLAVDAMCKAMIHRGPDDQGIVSSGICTLGMRRLSIIDLNTGHQPLTNEDGSVIVVCNGEIYNYKEIRQKLIQRGHAIASLSDVAVIPHLYEEMGASCIEELRGMFALAIWDKRNNKLILARDRLGEKPLFFYENGGLLVFASELRALTSSGFISGEIDGKALSTYFLQGRVPQGTAIYKGVRKVKPAHYIQFQDNCLEERRYWRPSFAQQNHKPRGVLLTELEALLKESVALRLQSDVPFGAFLSGGVDSSLVVAIAQRLQGERIKTFSIGYHEKSVSEAGFARVAARHIGTEHHEFIVDPPDPDLITHCASFFSEPFSDASFLPTYFVSKLAAGHVKVVLTGDGGDEIFAGYEWYKALSIALRLQKLPLALRAVLARLGDNLPQTSGAGLIPQLNRRLKKLAGILRHDHRHPAMLLQDIIAGNQLPWNSVLDLDIASDEQLLGDRIAWMEEYDGPHDVERAMYTQMQSLLPDLFFTKVDTMTMANSIESRAPLVDHMLVEYAAGIPFQWKLRNGESKFILKKLAEQYLPKELLYRRKQGFGIPLSAWMKKGLYRSYFYDNLLDQESRNLGIWKTDKVEAMLEEHVSGKENHFEMLWRLLCLSLWMKHQHVGTRQLV